MLSSSLYAQKSRLFLLPLLEIKKDPFIKPVNTFLFDKNKDIGEYRLILPFKTDDSSEFNVYENTYILNSKYIDQQNYYETGDLRVYVFDLSSLKEDYDKFLAGKYTTFSTKVKSLINIYWGNVSKNRFFAHSKIDAYLNPTYTTYELYSQELGIPTEQLIEIRELIDPPNLFSEVFDYKDVKYKKQLEDEVEN